MATLYICWQSKIYFSFTILFLQICQWIKHHKYQNKVNRLEPVWQLYHHPLHGHAQRWIAKTMYRKVPSIIAGSAWSNFILSTLKGTICYKPYKLNRISPDYSSVKVRQHQRNYTKSLHVCWIPIKQCSRLSGRCRARKKTMWILKQLYCFAA